MVEGQRCGLLAQSASPVCLGVPRARAGGPLGLPQLGLPVHHVHHGWEPTLLASTLARLASSSAYYFAEAGGASGPWPVARGVGGHP